jgi:hypothetical protein
MQNVPKAQKSFWTKPMVLLCDEAELKLVLVHLEIVLILMQDRCTVYVEHTIGSETVLDAPVELLGYEAQLEVHFGVFGDSAKLDAR